ncbi:MAG: VWA domain-containing protein [Aureispira sp.]|nr:VWA domain-containing protein [Aureispira sp.]
MVPLLTIFFWVVMIRINKQRELFGAQLLARLAPDLSPYKRPVKFGLSMLAVIFMITALANFRMGNKTQTVKREGVDVFIALDVSKSMRAEDIKPNRMQRARQFATKLVNALRGDRVGLILFAGQAYLQMPLTIDYSAALLFVRTASPDLEITQGTAIEEAIDLAMKSGQTDENKKQRALVVITDGENHESVAVDMAKKARAEGVSTFMVAVGTEKGAPIPLQMPGYSGFQQDKQGKIVQSKLNKGLLKQIAEAGGGQFYHISEGDAIITRMQRKMSKLQKEEFEQRNFDTFETYFQYFVVFALLFLIIEFALSYRKNKWLEKQEIFD